MKFQTQNIIYPILLVIALFSLFYRGCNYQTNKIDELKTKTDSILNQRQKVVDSLKTQVIIRDTLLAKSRLSLDTTINNVSTYIKNYYSVTDTILKLITCDSIIVECGKLSVKCNKNDSLHRSQEKTLQGMILILQNSLDTSRLAYNKCEYQLLKEVKRKKFWRGGTILASAVVVVARLIK